MADKATIDAVKDALAKSKERRFTESVEIAINLKDVDLSQPKNRIDEEVVLPKGRGKSVKVAVIGTGEMVFKAKDVADIVITPEQLGDYAGKKKDARKLVSSYNFFVAEAPLMPAIGKSLGTVMGPRGKMPKPIPPGADPAPVVENMRKTVKIRTRDRMTFHVPIGTRQMSPEDLAENIDAVVRRVIARLERGRQSISSAYVKTTMGSAVRIL
ncbi:MAG: 50S ribosomal protein L1 [Candidatus Thermoplasmatota archaeon]